LSCYLEDSRLILTTDYFHEFIRFGRIQLRTYAFFGDQREMVISIILIHVAKMPTYVLLINWTDQGIRNVKDTIKRAEAFKSAVERSGGKMLDAYYTMGQHDFVATVELPNDESAMSILLALGVRGNVRTTTLKAFSLSEVEKVVSKLS
jgi:uncharacterized protein with GYD domain